VVDYKDKVEYVVFHNNGRVEWVGVNGRHHVEQYLDSARVFMVTTEWKEIKRGEV